MKSNSFDQRELELPRSTSVTCNENESVRSRIRKMGPICKTRKEVAVDFHKSSMEEDDLDLDGQLTRERLSDGSECMWLSSADPSPSLFLENYKSSNSSFHLSVDEGLISWLPKMASSYIYLDKGSNSTVDPEEETSLKTPVTDIISMKEDWKGEKTLTSVEKSHGNDASDSSDAYSESVKTSLRQCCEEYSSFDKCLTPCSTTIIFDSSVSSQISDTDSTSFLDCLVNLDGEDSKLISDEELDMDYLPSGFPSPSCNNSIYNDSTPNSEINKHTRYGMFSEHNSSDSLHLEDFSTDEPLFWPSECKRDWSSEETWKFFSMSPRKYTTELGMPRKTCSKSAESKFHVLKMDSRKDCRRRLDFSSVSIVAVKMLEHKQRSNTNYSKKIKPASSTTPSRLRRSTEHSAKIVPIEMEDDIKQAKNREVAVAKLNCIHVDLLQDDIISNEELPIETLLGLGEFDGHEGVDSEFNEDVFTLDDSF
ncbi:uncharacterized protein LOC8273715 [Ricinus communis]|nr:uncharacterized protein LOC8273715 [Ricinus communis]XP_048233567.1 uncharacterized protein LOC8273715 [Ricinus communis]